MKKETVKKLVKGSVYFACLAVVYTLFNILYTLCPFAINGVLLTTTPLKPSFALFCGYLVGLFGLLMWYRDLLEREAVEHQLQKGGVV